MKMNQLGPARGARKKEKRVGRGIGSGHGKTSTKGHKGHLARSGGGKANGFEGGQMPLLQRVPKRGFRNPFAVKYAVVNLKDLARFDAKEPISPARLVEAGLIGSKRDRVKILGEGEAPGGLTVQAHRFSKSAEEKIRKAKGRIELLK